MVERQLEPTGPLTDVPATRRAGVPSLGRGDVLAERFRIVGSLGEGGMGEVYEAEDLELGERVALKTLRAGRRAGEGSFEQFRREIQLARRVTHVNVCRTHDLFRHRGATRDGRAAEEAFVTMELLRGETLGERILRAGRLGTDEALPIVEQVVSALAAAHRAGVVHRDLKSENVILVREGDGVRAVVSDFGLAHAAGAAATSPEHRIVGTPAYMAPEQVEGRPATPATDIYALGVVMYEVVTGRVPFTGDTPLKAALRRLEAPPLPATHYVPGLDPRWDAAIDRCLRREPRERFASVEDVVALLRGEVRARPRARRRFVAGLAAAALLAMTGALLWRASAPVGRAGAPPLAHEPRRSMTVLAVQVPRGQAGDAAWLGEYLTERLEAELGAGGSVRVVPGEQRARVERERAAGGGASLREALGADVVVVGALSMPQGRLSIRLNARDAASEADLAATMAEGADTDPAEVAARAARDLRAGLALAPPTEVDTAGLRAGRLSSLEAAREYGAGLRALRAFDALAARAAFERAVAADPSHPLARAALGRALSALGLDDRARKEAQRAHDLSAPLPDAQRLAIEAQLREIAREWPRAVEIRREQRAREPDDPEHVIALAESLVALGTPDEGLRTLEAAGPAVVRDPRLAMAEARAALAAGQLDRAQDAVLAAVRVAEERGATVVLARARLLEAQVLRTRGALEASVAAGDEAARLFRIAGDRASVARALRHSADVRRYQGRTGEAKRLAEESLSLAREVGDVGAAATAVNRIASVLQEEGQLGASRKRYEEVRSMAPEIGDRELEATAMNNIGVSFWLAGDLVAARRQLDGALTFFRRVGGRRGHSFTLFNLGFVLIDLGDLEAAARAFAESAALSRELTQPSLTGMAVFGQGQVALASGDLALARRRHQEALEMRRGLDERGRVAESQVALAEIDVEEARLDAAEPLLAAALEEFARQARRDREAVARAVFAELLLRRGNPAEARREAERAAGLAAHTEFQPVQTAVAIVSARVMAGHDVAGAAAAARAAEERAQRSGHVPLALEASLVRGEAERALGRRGAREALLALADEARARGFGRIARRASRAAAS